MHTHTYKYSQKQQQEIDLIEMHKETSILNVQQYSAAH